MQVEKISTKNNSVSLKISLNKKEWDKTLDRAAADVAAVEKIPGFRPGKAPRKVVINKVGEARVLSTAIEQAVQEFYPVAVKQEGLRPVALPKISIDRATPENELVFTADVTVLPKVTLGDYKKIKIKKVVEPVTESQVEDVLKNIQKRQAEFVEVERPAKMGDWVEVDFVGYIDNKPFEGGQSKNHPMILGDKLFIPGFEEGIVGMRAKDRKTIEVEFPKDYGKTELAGKKAKFDITLHKVKSVNYPEINDKFVQKVSKFKTLDEFKADIKKFLEEEAEKRAETKSREDAIMELAKLVKVDLPDEMVDSELEAMLKDLRMRVAQQKMEFADYLKKAGVNEEGLKSQWRDQAKQRVLAGLALDELRKAEQIEVSDKEIEEEIKKLEAMYPQDIEKIREEYKKPIARDRLKNMLASRKAVDRLAELATP
ncbi:trigger factor [candidate division Kazan bacterium]|uniref:Trigger factor n=1 Tax=candidate division Kazan bacterium TaxID=2202143 RepID=A0A420ZDA8_UNCK3|nr:MAG: trigger factor [candidate division Kazan bacterium]